MAEILKLTSKTYYRMMEYYRRDFLRCKHHGYEIYMKVPLRNYQEVSAYASHCSKAEREAMGITDADQIYS